MCIKSADIIMNNFSVHLLGSFVKLFVNSGSLATVTL